MRYIKKYEEVISKNFRPHLKEGGFVLLDPEIFQTNIKEFIKTEIGEITGIDFNSNSNYPYHILYDKPLPVDPEYRKPKDKNFAIAVEPSDILYYSSNKEDLEAIIKSNKYNI